MEGGEILKVITHANHWKAENKGFDFAAFHVTNPKVAYETVFSGKYYVWL